MQAGWRGRPPPSPRASGSLIGLEGEEGSVGYEDSAAKLLSLWPAVAGVFASWLLPSHGRKSIISVEREMIMSSSPPLFPLCSVSAQAKQSLWAVAGLPWWVHKLLLGL